MPGASRASVAVVGGRGFVGGELLRLLLGHPLVDVTAVSSTSSAGKPVTAAHPHLRGLTALTFCAQHEVPEVDVLFVCTPHGHTPAVLDEVGGRAGVVIDLSADFRLTDPEVMRRHYGWHREGAHAAAFPLGLPELGREQLRRADRIAVPGCMATAAVLALRALADAGWLDGSTVTVDARTGSSGSGVDSGPDNTHALRSGVLRVFAPLGHRHEAEIEQVLGVRSTMTVTATPAVRGIQVLCHARLDGVTTPQLWRAYRDAYSDERFVRLVAHGRGAFRYPDPKTLLGSNFCDVGFVAGADGQVLVLAALDNLVKGAAGNAVQCMNVRLDLPEDAGLGFAGLHPV